MDDHTYCTHGSNDCEACDYWGIEEMDHLGECQCDDCFNDLPAMEESRALRTAQEWHGGQASPLYSFVSTGRVHDPEGMIKEIRACMRLVRESGAYSPGEVAQYTLELSDLMGWVEDQTV